MTATVAVRGEATREVDPEIATFMVTCSARDRDRSATLSRLAARVEALRGMLQTYAGALEKHETSRLSVYAETSRRGERVSAYVGNATTTVTVTDLDAVGEIMVRIADLEQVTVDGPFWALRPGSPVYREARQAAIADAVERAREYAAALGSHVTGLIEMSDIGMPGGAVPLAFASRKMAAQDLAGGMPELDLDPQRLQITANVEGRFTISDPTVLTDPLD
jgi:uncharacterized protein